jgi:uncharacterized protein YjbJ (UPF0337 family)
MGRAFYATPDLSVSSRTDANLSCAQDRVSEAACNVVLANAISINHQPSTIRKETMNKDQINGTVKDLAGKVQEAAGKTINNKEMQLKGLQKQVVGHAEKAIGDAKQGIKDVGHAVKHAVK